MKDTAPSPTPGWLTDFEPAPMRGSHPRVIAAYFDEVVIPDLCTEVEPDDEDDGRPSRRLLRGICEANEWPWNHVVTELRRRQLNTASKGTGISPIFTSSGIRVDLAKIDELGGSLAPRCPTKRRFIDTHMFDVVRFEGPCRSWCCPVCGPKKAEELLGQVRGRIELLDEVYFAQTPWEKNLASRIGQRRSTTGMNTFQYRCIDDRVTFIADRPIHGTAAPRSSRPMSPADALALLATDVFWVPGHHSHDWSVPWQPATETPPPKTGDLSYLIPVTFPDHLLERVMARFTAEAEMQFGARIDCGVFPETARGDLVKLLYEIIADVTVVAEFETLLKEEAAKGDDVDEHEGRGSDGDPE